MAKIQTPGHVQELQAEFKVREPFDLELLETIQPTVDVASQRIASLAYPRKCMGHGALTAGAGQNSEIILTCPSDVGIIIQIEEIWITDATTVHLRCDDGTPPVAPSAVLVDQGFRDGRIIDQLPDGIIQTADPLSAAPNGRRVSQVDIPTAPATGIFPIDWVLGSGSYFLVRQVTANAALAVTWLWTEFLLEDR